MDFSLLRVADLRVAGLWVAGLRVAGLWVAGLQVAGLWVVSLRVAGVLEARFALQNQSLCNGCGLSALRATGKWVTVLTT